MKINISREDIRPLKRIRNDNLKILTLYSRYLNECPTAINKELMSSLCADGTDEETAFLSALIYIFDLNEDNARDSEFVRRYLVPSLKKLSVGEYLTNEYRELLLGVSVSNNKWSLRNEKYQPFEAFPCGEGVSLGNFVEYPKIAFFDEEFAYPSISQNGIEWMSLKPNEIETMQDPIENAFGNITVFGLGLGYFAFCASQKNEVKSVTVIERDEDVVAIFKEHILPRFPHKDKIRIILSDAFDYMESKLANSNTDYVFTDIWHDTSDGLPLYLKAKKYEYKCPNAHFDYWIEQSMLQRLRWMVLDEYTGEDEGRLQNLPDIYDVDALYELLRDNSLKALSKKIEYNE